MPHAHHFLSRLDRVSLPHVELALGLYRDEALLRYILDRARPPEGAARVAISLEHPERGPFLIVTRDGHFVTCLGEGMTPGDLPIITRGQLDAIAAHREDLRARMAAAQKLAGGGNVHRLLHRVYDAGDALSREDFVAISALQPLYAAAFLSLVYGAHDELLKARDILIPELRKSERLHPRYKEGLRGYWQTHWAIGHFLVLAAMDGAQPELITPKVLKVLEGRGISWPAVCQARMPLALQGAWAVGRMGKPFLGLYKRLLRDSYDPLAAIDSVLGLCTLGLRHSRLQAEILKELASPLQPDLEETSRAGLAVRTVRKLAIHVLESDHQKPEEAARLNLDFGASTWMQLTRHLPPGAPYRYARQEDVPEDLAMSVAVNVDYNILQNRDTTLWLFSLVPWTARAAPEQLYLPREALRAIRKPWQQEDTLNLLRAQRDMTPRPKPPPRPEGPARKGPCPCGSGKKYKRCCGADAAEA